MYFLDETTTVIFDSRHMFDVPCNNGIRVNGACRQAFTFKG